MELEIGGVENMRKLVIPFVFLFALLAILCAYFLFNSAATRQTIIVVERKSKENFEERLKKEKELIRRDLEEKYSADIVSYNAMARRLEMEKQKVRELEGKIGPQAKKEGG